MWAASALGRKQSIQIGGFFALLGGALQGGAVNIGYVGLTLVFIIIQFEDVKLIVHI